MDFVLDAVLVRIAEGLDDLQPSDVVYYSVLLHVHLNELQILKEMLEGNELIKCDSFMVF